MMQSDTAVHGVSGASPCARRPPPTDCSRALDAIAAALLREESLDREQLTALITAQDDQANHTVARVQRHEADGGELDDLKDHTRHTCDHRQLKDAGLALEEQHCCVAQVAAHDPRQRRRGHPKQCAIQPGHHARSARHSGSLRAGVTHDQDVLAHPTPRSSIWSATSQKRRMQ